MTPEAKGGRRHIPQRTCVGCRQVLAKRAMTRVVRTADGVRIDPTGKANGRGAYLHDLASCWRTGLQGSLEHALRVRLSPADRLRLEEHMQRLPDDTPHDLT